MTLLNKQIWLKSLGHINFRSLKNLPDEGRSNIMQMFFFVDSKNLENFIGIRNPFSKNSSEHEFIQSDTFGKMPCPVVSAANFVVLFKDDCTRLT